MRIIGVPYIPCYGQVYGYWGPLTEMGVSFNGPRYFDGVVCVRDSTLSHNAYWLEITYNCKYFNSLNCVVFISHKLEFHMRS